MARLSTYPAKGFRNPGRVVIEGTFTTAGSSAPSTVLGTGFTVGAPSTGVYTITGQGKFNGSYAKWCDVTRTAGGTESAKITSLAFSSGSWTLTIETQSADGTAANLTGPEVSFQVVFRDTSVTK